MSTRYNRAWTDRRFHTVVLVFAAALATGYLIWTAFGPLPLLDLRAHLEGGQAWLNGQDPYRTALSDRTDAAHAGSGFVYPPYTVPFFALLDRLGERAASMLWQACQLLALAVAVWLLATPRSWRRVSLLTIMVVCFYPVLSNLALGQAGLVSLALLLAAWTLLDTSPTLAGTLMGAAGVLKLFPLGLTACAAIRRRWCSVATAAGVVAACVAVTWPWTANLWPEYLSGVLLGKAQVVTTSPGNQSLAAAVYRSLTDNPFQRPLFNSPAAAHVLAVAIPGALLVGLAIVLRRVRLQPRGLDLAISLAALPLLLPYAWQHYYVLAIPLLWMVSCAAVSWRDGWLAISATLAFICLSLVAGSVDHGYFAVANALPAIHGVYANASVIGDLVLVLGGIRLALRQPDLAG